MFSVSVIILYVQIRVKSHTKKRSGKNTRKLADMVVKFVKLRYNHNYQKGSDVRLSDGEFNFVASHEHKHLLSAFFFVIIHCMISLKKGTKTDFSYRRRQIEKKVDPLHQNIRVKRRRTSSFLNVGNDLDCDASPKYQN